MKLYNKKSFISGAVSFLLGLALLLCCILKAFELKFVLLMFIMFLFAMTEIRRSMSYQMSKEDKIAELDERNRFIRLKSRSKALNVTQNICFLLQLAFMMLGAIANEKTFLSIGMGLAFSFSVSMIAEIGACIYYENHT